MIIKIEYVQYEAVYRYMILYCCVKYRNVTMWGALIIMYINANPKSLKIKSTQASRSTLRPTFLMI